MDSSNPEKSSPGVCSPFEALKLVGCGMCMGAADLVPGVSGGTMAFITGIYEEFLEGICSFDLYAMKCLITLRLKEFNQHIAWKFLALVLLGMVISILSLSSMLFYLLNHPVYRCYLYASFLGLILGSVFFCAQKVRRWSGAEIGMMIVGAALAFVISSVPVHRMDLKKGYDVFLEVDVKPIGHSGIRVHNFDEVNRSLLGVSSDTLAAMLAKGVVSANSRVFSHVEGQFRRVGDVVQPVRGIHLDPWLVLCGAIAVSAMLLPGVSGSYLLTLLGCYPQVIGALADLVSGAGAMQLDFHASSILSSLGLGIFLGLLVFSRFITWLLHHYHEGAVALLIGFMLGALRSVWPFWDYEYQILPLKLSKGLMLIPVAPSLPGLTSSLFLGSIFLAVLCFTAVLGVERWAQRGRLQSG